MALLSLGHLCDFHLEKSKGGVGGEIGQAVQLWISVLCTPVACVVLGLCEANEDLPGWLTIQWSEKADLAREAWGGWRGLLDAEPRKGFRSKAVRSSQR